MTRTLVIDLEDFNKGFQKLEDTTKAPFGAARVMKNCQITDRGGIAPRPGITRVGGASPRANASKGFYTFTKSFTTNEFLMRTNEQKVEVLSKNEIADGWTILKDGLTLDAEMGFVTSLVNEDNQDYVIMSNRFDDYMSWDGAISRLDGALVGGETDVTVDSVLEDEIFEEKTATANTISTVTVTAAGWATDQWVGLYIYFPGSGKVRRILANTYDGITFEALGAPPGNVVFEIHKIKFPLPRITDTTFTFADNTPLQDTIFDSNAGFFSAGLRDGMEIVITGSASNNGTFTIDTVTDDTITLISSDVLVAEATGATVTIVAILSVIYAGIEIQYTDIDVFNKLVVASAHAAADDTILLSATRSYNSAPRGNRLANYLTRIVQGNVRSARARDKGGALQGYSAAGSYFVSNVKDPFDYDFDAARLPGQGDIVGTPYGGGDITDIQTQEDRFYIFKRDYIESATYSQDASDTVLRVPLKAGVGSVGKTIRGTDDIYFMTPDKRFTSVGRVIRKDLQPQTEDLGFPIKRFLDTTDVEEIGRGIEYKDRIFIPVKSNKDEDFNNIAIIYNKRTRTFEGVWNIGAFGFQVFDDTDDLYIAQASCPDVFKVDFDSNADVEEDDRFAISSEYATHFFNLTASNSNTQAMNGFYVEGYIRPETTITFNLFKDFSQVPFLTFDCDFDEQFVDGVRISAHLGRNPLAIAPMAALAPGQFDPEGWQHFSLRIYFPHEYGNHFSVGHSSSGVDFKYEITRYGLMISDDPVINQNRIKNL